MKRKETFYIKPQQQQRPRFVSRGKFTRAYDPKPTADFKTELTGMALQSNDDTGYQPLDGQLKVTLDIYIAPMKSWTKKKTEQALSNELRPTSHSLGDIDNHVKSIFDSFNKVLWTDDDAIVEMHVAQWFSNEPRIEIEIEQV